MVAAGLVEAGYRQIRNTPFGGHQAHARLTPAGRQIANQLRQFRAQHGTYNGFTPAS
jgi:hypothetical protein